jgi:hypothetical protein
MAKRETTAERLEREVIRDVEKARKRERTECPKEYCGDKTHQGRVKVGKNVSVGVSPRKKGGELNVRVGGGKKR